MFIEVPKGWEKFYPKNVVLELLATLRGLKQRPFSLFIEVLRIMKDISYKRSGLTHVCFNTGEHLA